ncbi:hypothetical protein PROPHIGD43A-5_44 [Mycobacterium phage prophiGD43A-5]|nr:hypothetical protein PROPHIGD43A-5_44 [Mycobacterium phage prophiGD43A-5]
MGVQTVVSTVGRAMSETPVTAELLRQIRRDQGRTLHQARHLWPVLGLNEERDDVVATGQTP